MDRGGIGRHRPLTVSVIALLVTLVVLPFVGRQLGSTVSFVPAVLATVACFDLMSMWLLAGEYVDTGDRRMLAMGIAYLWSLVLMAGYALAFPGVVSVHPPLAVAVSVAPYLYIGWHVGFPVLLGAAWVPWAFLDRAERVPHRRTVVAAVTLATTILAVGVVAACVVSIDHLPVLIHGLDTTAMTRLTAPVALPLVFASLVVCTFGVRARPGPERWAQLAIAACACDLLLTYTSHYRYSMGWYAGRTMTVVAAATVLVAMLAAFRTLKEKAEFNAAYDGLTGLPNRRHTYDALTTMIAQAQRRHTRLTVVMFDLDHFKQINDTFGHAGGDAVLRAVAETVRKTVRESDIVGRVGGEEFLILLPDASDDEACVAIERLRASLRNTGTRYRPSGVTASFGVAMLDAADTTADSLANRADQAMYSAKTAGRDRIARYAHTADRY